MRILHVGDDFAALRPCGLTLYSDALMRAQAERGHHVAYLFSGRVYPRLPRPRLKRWRSGPVQMIELIGAPLQASPDRGTRHPLAELDEPVGEAAFAAALRDERPEVIHVHELARLPTSILERARDVPVTMTLHDYKPACASVRLLDAGGERCMRTEVGADCALNCADAPEGHGHLVEATMRFERGRLKRLVPFAERVDFSPVGPLLGMLARKPPEPASAGPAPPALVPEHYQHRRERNLRRLALCDRLVAPSAAVAEIYARLGVPRERIEVQRLTLPHLERLRPRRGATPSRPLTFATLGAAASRAKGSRALVEAVRALGGRRDYRLIVLGPVEPALEAELAAAPQVTLLGPYAPDALDDALEAADVGIVPSIWEEVHGFVGIELLAKGLPVIGSALGGIVEYVREGETGWLNSDASGAGLAAIMARLVDHPDDVERLRASVRARRRELVRPMADHVGEVERLYGELIAVRRRASAASA